MKPPFSRPRRWPAIATLIGAGLTGCAAPEAPARSFIEVGTQPPAPPPVVPETIDTGPFTFYALVDTALEESPDLHLTAARIAQARAGLQSARAAWWPTVDFEASYLRADAPSLFLFKTIDAGNFVAGTDFNDPGAFSNWEAGVSARFNLYNGGRDELRESIAGAAITLAELEAEAVENALVAGLTDGWYGVRATEEQMLTAQASIETIEAQLSEARARHQHGEGLRTDVLSLEVRRAESEEMLSRATNGRDFGLAALAQLAGIEDMGSLELAGPGPATGLGLASAEEALARAQAARPELARARRMVSQARRGVDVSKASYWPRADAFARGWRDDPEFAFDESRDNWAVGVSLSWNIFDGRRGAGVEDAHAQLNAARHRENKAALGIQLEVRAAWLRTVDARARVTVATQAVDSAATALALVRAQYAGGAALITRYLETELMLTQSRTRQTNARHDLERAQAELARSVGHYKNTGNERP